jgi:hypothetical protein
MTSPGDVLKLRYGNARHIRLWWRPEVCDDAILSWMKMESIESIWSFLNFLAMGWSTDCSCLLPGILDGLTDTLTNLSD